MLGTLPQHWGIVRAKYVCRFAVALLFFEIHDDAIWSLWEVVVAWNSLSVRVDPCLLARHLIAFQRVKVRQRSFFNMKYTRSCSFRPLPIRRKSFWRATIKFILDGQIMLLNITCTNEQLSLDTSRIPVSYRITALTLPDTPNRPLLLRKQNTHGVFMVLVSVPSLLPPQFLLSDIHFLRGSNCRSCIHVRAECLLPIRSLVMRVRNCIKLHISSCLIGFEGLPIKPPLLTSAPLPFHHEADNSKH